MAIDSTYTPASSKLIHTTYVDMSNRAIVQPVHVVQYDSSLPILAVKLYNQGQEYTIPEDENVNVNIRLGKSDGKIAYNPAVGCSSDRTIVYFILTRQMNAAYGMAFAVVEIELNNETLQSSYIQIAVDKNPAQYDTICSTNEHITAKEYAEIATEAANDAEAEADIAVENANAAAASAAAAAASEEEATNQAEIATQAASNASKSAINSANNANAALASQEAAAESEANAKASEEAAKQYAEWAQAAGNISIATTEVTGIVMLTSDDDVTDTTGLAVAATELNPDIDGTLANHIDNMEVDADNFETYFYTYYTKVSSTSDVDATAMATSDVTDAINTEWNGESTTDETAMSSSDVTESVETEWNGESSDDDTALSASDISNITT